ncbi:MAG: hypothetical protein ACYDHY_06590 [Acidiferrobacterales bacterium]
MPNPVQLPECPHNGNPKFNIKIVQLGLEKLNQGEQLFIKVTMTCPLCQRHYTFRGHSGLSTNEPAVAYDYESVLIPIDYPTDEESVDEEGGEELEEVEEVTDKDLLN